MPSTEDFSNIDLSEDGGSEVIPPVPPSKDTNIKLDNQKYNHRKFIFMFAIMVCVLLYLLFFFLVFYSIFSPAFFSLMIAHKHLCAIFVILLFVPSVLLWGLMKSVYSSDILKQELDGIIKVIKEIYPPAS